MSTRFLTMYKIYSIIKESIDYENAQSIPLKINQKVIKDINGYNLGIVVEKIGNEHKNIFPKTSGLYINFDPNTYYNVGFDIDGKVEQTQKTDYKVLSKILGVVIKSTIDWIKTNQPEVITIFADGATPKEREKKLNIYGSVLAGDRYKLENIGYHWDFITLNGEKGLYIAKL